MAALATRAATFQPTGLLLIAGQHVGCADKGTNSAEPDRVIIAGIALPPIGRDGLSAEQPETSVSDDAARVRKYEVN